MSKNYHEPTQVSSIAPQSTVALVGHSNVGKSVLFHRLTGLYVHVSNYPGTTVDIAHAPLQKDSQTLLLDTPGVVNFPARADDERVLTRTLLEKKPQVIVQVGDSKNLRRTLALTALLMELGKPMVLVLNLMDEAENLGIHIDCARLKELLGIPVIATVATQGLGIDTLLRTIASFKDASEPSTSSLGLMHYDSELEKHIQEIENKLESIPEKPLPSRALAILALGYDPEVLSWFSQHNVPTTISTNTEQSNVTHSSMERMQNERSEVARLLTEQVLTHSEIEKEKRQARAQRLSQNISRWVVHPFWSWIILLIALYLIYQFVGVFGATYLVGLLEEDLFGSFLNPLLTQWVDAIAPWKWVSALLVGQYGLWTMGMTYALALIFPIVITFFIAFSLLEDSGYLPRLSVVVNRVFTWMGLNGHAVLPMILGLGCVTMATLTTRTLRHPRDRLITTFLLALAIPCSAQLGVVLGLLGGYGFVPLLIWSITMFAIFLIAGFAASALIRGKRIPLVAELPPMRLPIAGNVLKKTAARLKWYLLEVIPLFLLGAFLMFLLDLIGILPKIITLGEPLVTGWLGLPKEASAAFVMGFLRRDFGATGLFALADQLSTVQALVGMVTITLFIPCIASLLMIVREQGLRIALAMVALIVPTAFLVGGVFRLILNATGFE